MPLDLFKRDVPGINDTAHAENDFRDFSVTLHSPIPVSGETEAEQIAASAPDTAFPMLFIVGEAIYLKNAKASPWLHVAGRQAWFEADVSRAISAGGAGAALIANRITKSTPGWTISSDGTKITVPDSGLYVVQGELLATDAGVKDSPNPDVGKAYIQITAGSKTFRNAADNNSRSHVVGVWWLTAGDTVGLHYTHNASDGSQRSLWGSLIAGKLAS